MPQIIMPPVDPSLFQTSTLLNGEGPPANTVGRDNDFYIDIQGPNLYGPKTNGQWPSTYESMVGNPVLDFHTTTPQKVTQTGVQTITLPISNPSFYAVYYNGQRVPDNLITQENNVLTISAALDVSINDYLQADYSGSSAGGIIRFTPADEIPIGAIDGTNTAFTLRALPISNTLKLFLNGAALDPSEYTLTDENLVLVVPPAATSRLRASYFF